MKFYSAMVFITACSASFMSYAEDNEPSEVELDTVTIRGSDYRNTAFSVHDTEGSTATKSALPLLETPLTVNIIGEELIELRGATSINQIVGYTAGITPETRGSTGSRYDQLTIRGHDPKFSSYWDGLKLLYNGGYLGLQIDPFLLQRVEVLKGPASVLYGANPPGGLINQVSHRPLGYDETVVGLKTGNRSLVSATFDTSTVAWDNNSSGGKFRLLAKYNHRDGQPEHTEMERRVLMPTMELRFGDSTRLVVKALYQHDPSAGGYGMQPREGTLVEHPSGEKIASDFYDGDINFEVFDRIQKGLGYQFTHAFNDQWAFNQNVNVMQNSLKLENVGNNFSSLRKIEPNDPYANGLVRYILKSDENLDFITADNQLSGTVFTGPVTHHLLFGFDIQDSSSSRITGKGVLPHDYILDIFDTNNNQLTDHAQALNYLEEIRSVETITRQLGWYFQDQIKFHGLTLMYSGRQDKATSEQVIRRADTDTLISQLEADDSAQTNRFGGLYLFESVGIAPYVSWSESFEPTVDLDKNGNKFEPTTGEQLEYGIKYENAIGNISATLSIFNLDQKDVIRPDPQDPSEKISIPGLTTEGFEFEADLRINSQWKTTLGYSELDMTQEFPLEPELNGKTPVGVAESTFSNWWQYNPVNDLTLAMGIRHVGESQGNEKNTFTVDAYTLFDFSMSYEHRIHRYPVKWLMTANNVMDKYYVSSCFNSDVCWIGSERTIDVGVEVTF